MKHAISLLSSVAFISATLCGVAHAQQPSEEAPAADQALSPEERARQVEELASTGADAYRAGDYEGAIEDFKRGYEIEPVPNLLYNIAKSYEKLERYADAVDYYQKFVVAPEVDSGARQAALDRIESLREIAQLKSQQNDARSGAEEPAAAAAVAPAPEEPTNYAAIATLGGSVVLLGGGLLMGYMASDQADLTREGATYQERADAQSSGQTYALVADSLFVAAAVAAGIGVYFLVSDSGSEAQPTEASARTVISPWVTTRSAGLGLSLDF